MCRQLQNFVCLFTFFLVAINAATGQELIKAPQGYVKYKLSNLRVENNALGEVIAIDYQRTGKGQGDHQVQIAVRTDAGRLGVMGFSMIEESGTIRLRDQFAGLSRVLGQRETGMEFFMVVNSRGMGGYYDPGMARMFGGKEYLVSNVLRRGTMNSKISPRDLTKEELAAHERARKASLPPETVPNGYTRGTASTALVVGAPIKVGQGGKWADAEVVALPSASQAKVKIPNSDYLRTVNRKDWIAVSSATARQIRDNPKQFSTDIRTLPGGNLALRDGVEALQDAMSLLKGTPLIREYGSQWQDVHFLSSDNVSARVLVNQFNKYKVELVPKNKLAIRGQTLEDMKRDGAEQTFLANVDGYETQVAGLAKFPGSSGAALSSKPGLSQGALSGGMSGVSSGASYPSAEPESSDTVSAAPMRTWSDSTGKFQVEAQLVEKTEQSVTLKRANGKIAKVPLNKLSKDDLAYLKNLDEEKADNPFAALMEEDTAAPAARAEVSGADLTGNTKSQWNYRLPLKTVSKVTDLGWGPKSVAISPDKKQLIIGRGGSEVSICDLESGRILMSSGRMDHMGDVTAAAYTPDGKYLVIGGTKGTVEVYQVAAKGKLNLKTQFAAHTKDVLSIAFSSDGKFALTGGADKEARYWEVKTGRQVASMRGFEGKVKATCVRADNSELLATDGKTLIVLEASTEKVIRQLQVGRSPHTSQGVAISPNGLLLAMNDGYKIVLWNLQNFRQMPTMDGTDIPWKLVFAPDSQHLFSGHNGVVNVWDTKSQSRVISCTVGSSSYVQTLGVSADGSTIACSSAFAEVTVLRAAPAE